jgi:spoIIIJ-associated protein
MSEYQEFTGKSVEEALRNAREAFGVGGLEDLDFEILTQGSRGVLGMGAEPARIIAAPRSALGGSAPKKEAAAALPPPRPSPAEPRDARPRSSPSGARPGGEGREDSRGAESRGEGRGGSARHDRGGDRHDRGDRRRARGGPAPGAIRVGSASSAEVEAAVAASPAIRREPVEEVELTPEALAAGRELLERLVELMGYEARVEVSEGPSAKITVYGADDAEKEALGALIGRKGERLSALQHLVNLMLSRKVGTWTRVLVDVEDYRGRRERQLVEVATRAAEHVRQTGQMLQLEPMSALERRWVHLALRDMEGITTQSIGEEPMRRVVVLRI